MIPIISFIGWHNTGKTTVVREVVSHLKKNGLRVGVIKSTHHHDIDFDRPGSDTDTYRSAGADAISLLAPDQLIIMTGNPDLKLVDLVARYFYDVDIVIGEGFKNERHIRKIEVARGNTDLLRDQVNGVVAVMTDQPLSGEDIFRLDQHAEVAEFIIHHFLAEEEQAEALLYVNGKKIPMKGFVQDALAGTVAGFVRTLKQAENLHNIDLKIRLK